MKKQIRRAMLATVAMMLMGIVSLTGVTYAWFSQSDTAQVGGMELGIVSKEGGVLISAIPNPSQWGYRLDLDIKETDYNPSSMVPENIKSDGTIQFYNGVIDEATPSRIYTEAIGQDKYYIVQDIYFYNDNLEDDITVIVNKEATKITGEHNGADMAMRLAIVAHGDYAKGTNGDVKTTDSANVSIYEFNAKQHLDGVVNTRDTYGVKAASGVENYFDTSDIANGLGNSEALPYLSKTNTVHKDSVDNISFVIPADSCYRITVYLWLEGQDDDCTISISGGNMGIQLGFENIGVVED